MSVLIPLWSRWQKYSGGTGGGRGREGTREGGREGREGGREGGEGGRRGRGKGVFNTGVHLYCMLLLSQSLTPSISPSLTPSLHLSLTLIGALANGAQILSSAVDKPDKRVHVSLAAIAADWSPCSVVHQLERGLGRWRREGGRERGEGREGGRSAKSSN